MKSYNMTRVTYRVREKYRIREVTMANGEVRFYPERTEGCSTTAMRPSAIWVQIGPIHKYHPTLEEARQRIDEHKRSNPAVISEVIHEID